MEARGSGPSSRGPGRNWPRKCNAALLHCKDARPAAPLPVARALIYSSRPRAARLCMRARPRRSAGARFEMPLNDRYPRGARVDGGEQRAEAGRILAEVGLGRLTRF